MTRGAKWAVFECVANNSELSVFEFWPWETHPNQAENVWAQFLFHARLAILTQEMKLLKYQQGGHELNPQLHKWNEEKKKKNLHQSS